MEIIKIAYLKDGSLLCQHQDKAWLKSSFQAKSKYNDEKRVYWKLGLISSGAHTVAF